MSKAHAEQVLHERLHKGRDEQQRLIERVEKMVIRDRLWPPTGLLFEPQFDDLGAMTLTYQREGVTLEEGVRIHRHALNQMAVKIEMPMTFVNKAMLQGGTDKTIWRREELAQIFTTHFHKEEFKQRGGRPPSFLHRLVGNELRGFLSRSYNRHLASKPMLAAFLEACRKSNAQPVEAITTDIKLALKCFIPAIFEPVPGELIAVGVEWANSDFGSGKLTVSLCAMRVTSRTSVSLSEDISRVHLGSVIEESDIEMSDETAVKEVETQASAIRDSVAGLLDQSYLDRLLKAIERAHEEELSWTRLKGQLGKFLYKDELTTIETLLGAGGLDLPPVGHGADGQPLPTRWWASNIVSMLANQAADEERKHDLQREAGKLLDSAFEDGQGPKAKT